MMEATNDIKKDVLISIKGTQKISGETDVVEMMTTGRFYRKNQMYYISYEETEATGYAGCRTTLKVGPHDKVTMTRFGSARSQLIVEQGVRHQCQYDTGYGAMTIGVMGNSFENRLSEKGGKLSFGYTLDIETTVASENTVTITLKEILANQK